MGLFDSDVANLRFARGAIGNVESFLNARHGYDIRTEIVGTKDIIQIGSIRLFVEFSTATSTPPDLLELAEGATVADEATLELPHVEGLRMQVAPTRLGQREFVGNSGVLPTGTTLGEGSLVGADSTARRLARDRLRVLPGGGPRCPRRDHTRAAARGLLALVDPHRGYRQSFWGSLNHVAVCFGEVAVESCEQAPGPGIGCRCSDPRRHDGGLAATLVDLPLSVHA